MKKKTGFRILTVFIPVICLFLYLMKDELISMTSFFPPCFVYSLFHLYCPACGNTRSVIALLQGDLLASLHYNIVPFIILLLSLAAYGELVAYSFGKPVRLLPRKLRFYIILILLVYGYLFLRNLIPVLAP